jgi:tyrosyl-tRNA synthetase
MVVCGVKVGDEKITDKNVTVTADMFTDGKLLIEKGKKKKYVVEL